jgi:lambda family phage portal protein
VEAFGGLTGERQVLHVAERLRIDQPRGVPLLAPVIKQLKQMSRYADHELQAAVVSSLLTVLITSEHSLDDGPGLDDLDDGSGHHYGPAAINDNEIKLAPGAVGRLEPGEKIETVNPSRPNAQFDPFMSAMAQIVGAGIGIPYELLIKRFTASYSASRASLLQAWRAFDRRQTWLVECFCQPVYEWVIAEAIDRGYLDAPGFHEDPFLRAAYLRAEWRGPTMGQLDPLKEVLAAERRVAAGYSTRAAESASLTGLDADQVHEQLVREKNRRVRDGLELPLLASGSAPRGAPSNAGELVRRESEQDEEDEEGSPADGMDEPEEMIDVVTSGRRGSRGLVALALGAPDA